MPVLAFGRAEFKIVTASERGTYIQIGRDLAKWVADPAGVDLEVLPSKGSAAAGNRQAGEMIKPLRVILPLYNEEIYFVARADSPLTYIHEIKDKKLNVGPVGSGTALSATTLYRLMFGQSVPDANASYLSNEEALSKLISDTSLDVVVIVAGQPAKLFADMKPEARQYIKLLRLDDKAPETAQATKTYFPATIRSSSYPSWLTEDVPTLTVKAFLVTYDYNLQATKTYLNRFAQSLCVNFDALQGQGHPKWREVKMELPSLGKGWSYYPPMERELRTCVARRAAAAPKSAPRPVARECTQQERVLALCGN
jgi:TRAP-type uncharacterized transport system substrate-binding protein